MTRITKVEEFEIDFDIDDVIDFIEQCDSDELETIRSYILSTNSENTIFSEMNIETLYDKMKLEEIKRIWNKYSLEALQKL